MRRMIGGAALSARERERESARTQAGRAVWPCWAERGRERASASGPRARVGWLDRARREEGQQARVGEILFFLFQK
jgi:hypothetical protein